MHKKITIVSVTGQSPEASEKAIMYTSKNLPIPHKCLLIADNINSLDEYSDYMLGLIKHIDTDFALVVQPDGYGINNAAWDDNFLNFDYIGANWPNHPTWMERQKLRHYVNFVGNGGFSLRSRKFMELSAKFKSCEGFGEDVYLANIQYEFMIANGIKFAPVEVAEKFSRENNILDWTNPGKHEINSSFGFHGKNFSNWEELVSLKYR